MISTKPTTLGALHDARTGSARPRTFSASAQKMCPPSSGRNGNRFTSASDSEMIASTVSARTQSNSIALARDLVGADDAGDLLALLGVVEDPRDRVDGRAS